MGGSGNLPIGPGVWGFIALFVLAIALWLLVRNMNARLRRMAYRERERLEAEEGGTASTESTGPAVSSEPTQSTAPDTPEEPGTSSSPDRRP